MSNKDHITKLLKDASEEHVFSGYQVLADHQGRTEAWFGGQTSYWPEARPVSAATRFDLGSLTKVIVTTSIVARYVQSGKLTLDSTVAEYSPVFKETRLGRLRLETLLNHCSGVRAWYPMFQKQAAQHLAEWLLEKESELCISEPRIKACYSDIGFWLLGLVLESFGDLNTLFLQEVGQPLGLTETSFVVPQEATVASTEYSSVRERLLAGEVFDENANHLGGVAAHAGLFSTARSLKKFCRAWLEAVAGRSDWLKADVANVFVKRTDWVPSSSWAMGWDTRSSKGSTSGQYFSNRSFGHLGYTGTSIWLDPEADAFVIFLSNRVHPSRLDKRIRKIRPLLHDAISKHWGLHG